MDNLPRGQRQLCLALAATATGTDAIEIRCSRQVRRKHRIMGARVRSTVLESGMMSAVIRLARDGREAYATLDHLTDGTGRAALERLYGAVLFGIPVADDAGPGGPVRWREEDHVDAPLGQPDSRLSELWETAQSLAMLVAERPPVRFKILDIQLNETRHTEVFVRTGWDSLGFARTELEVRLLLEVEHRGASVRLWAARQLSRLSDLPVADLLLEAQLRAAAMLATTASGPTPTSPLLLLPRSVSAMLRVIALDVFSTPPTRGFGGDLRHSLVDDPHAKGGPHSRPYDHEGTPTRPTVLIDESGARARTTVRASGTRAGRCQQALTGHGYLLPGRGMIEAYPTNVRLVPLRTGSVVDPVPDGFTGLIGFNLRGDGTQHLRAGGRIHFRIETAGARDGVVTGKGEDLFIAADCPGIISAIDAVGPTTSYVPGRGFSTGCAWAMLNRPNHISCAPPT